MPEPFGHTQDGRSAVLHFLENDCLRVAITDYGGRMVSIEAPDRNGKRDHILLGFSDVHQYETAGGSFGALLGRTANRIGHGCFRYGGETFDLSQNEGENTLHGGKEGFGQKFWTVAGAQKMTLTLTLVSPDGDQGFPGEVRAEARYALEGNQLTLDFRAQTTRPTPLSLSAHPYFNLAGAGAPDMLDHGVTIMAGHYLPTDKHQLPTGEIADVAGTPFDFREERRAEEHIRAPHPQILYGKGYDHFFVAPDGAAQSPRPLARIRHQGSGRTLEILSTYPGTQFYSGNNLNGTIAGRGGAYRQSAGFAFEPQGFPDAPNRPEFPSTILKPGDVYRQMIAYRFGTF